MVEVIRASILIISPFALSDWTHSKSTDEVAEGQLMFSKYGPGGGGREQVQK